MITFTLAVILVCLYILTRFRERRARRFLAGLPCKPCLPFVGNFYQFIGGSKALLQKINELCETAEKYDKPVVAWAGSYPIVLLCNPADVKLVSNAFIEKPYFYNFSKPLLGNSLFSAPGSIWKRNIKKVLGSGSFSTSAMPTYQEKFSACALTLAEQLGREAGRGPFDATEMIVMTTLTAICQTMLGSEISSEPAFVRRYYAALNDFMQLVLARGLNLLLHPDVVFHLTPTHRKLMENVAVLREVTQAVMSQINQQRKEMEKSRNSINGNSQAKSFYENLLKLHKADPSTFSMEHVLDEIHTIILAAPKTVATTLVFTFLAIGHYTDVQKKLYAELKEIYGESKRPVASADLARMPYCEAVISETLRLYPPGPLVLRRADSDLTLESCTIPKGATCAIGVWGLHRSRRLWGPDALQFRPERWLEPDCPGSSAAFAPFSYGRRACFGKKYAITFLKTIVAQCARQLEFKSDISQLELKVDAMLKPANLILELGDGWISTCAASIVGRYRLVTSAHCLTKTTSQKVWVGSEYVFYYGTQYATRDFTPHSLFNLSHLMDYDIGVVRIPSGIEFSSKVTRSQRGKPRDRDLALNEGFLRITNVTVCKKRYGRHNR